jgi:hypothetical protein
MARFNSSLISNTITGTASVGSPYNGSFTALTGTAPYTVTLANPTLFPGINQQFYNSTSGTVTLSTPAGNFTGAGGSAASTLPVYAGNVVSITADGTNYIVISEDGSALTATSATVSGVLTVQSSGGVAIAPSTTGNIDNVNVGATTRGSGAFNTLAANNAVTFTANTASTTTGTGTLVITGGLGVSGAINATSVSASLTGTIQTAAQANITSVGTLTGLTVSGNILSQAATTASAGSIQVTATDASLRLKWTSSPVADKNTWEVRSVGTGSVPYLQFRTINDANTVFTDRVAFTNDGNVGIGTATPGANLEISAGGPQFILNANTQAVNVKKIRLASSNNTAGDFVVSAINDDNSLKNYMLYVSNAGNVGLGTTSPQTRLDVSGTLRFTPNTADTNYSADIFASYNSEHPFQINVKNNGSTAEYFGIYASAGGASNRVVFPTGNVGIGVTNPQTLLELNQGGAYTQVKHLTLSRNENTRYNAYAGFGDQFGGNTFGWRFGTVNNSTDYPTLYMVNGNVGIGTAASPVTRLQANTNTSMASSGSVVDVLSLTDNNGVSNGVTGARIGLTISAQSDITDRRIGIYATANTANFNAPDITFWASGQGIAYREMVRFSAQNGNVGVGTGANPAAKLHVINSSVSGIGGVPSGSSVIVDSNSNNYLTFRNTADNATQAGLVFQDNNVGGFVVFKNYTGTVATGSDSMLYGTYQDHIFLNGASETVGYGGKTERMRILSNGKINRGGVSDYYTAGDTQGTTSFYIDVPVENDNTGTANHYHIQCSFSHANWGAYGCLLDTWYNARGAGNFIEQYDIRAVTSANGGSWSISKPSANSIRITKNAGSYVGGGPYWIRVTMAA